MSFIFECKYKNKTWVLLPTAILFLKGAETTYDGIDFTFAWLCFGLTFRFENK